MKKMMKILYKGIFCLSMLVATTAVNSACFYKLYQEELPDELSALKKYE